MYYLGCNLFNLFLDADYGLCIISNIHQQLKGYKVEEELHLGVRKQKKVEYQWCRTYPAADASLLWSVSHDFSGCLPIVVT
jgi:hypothetical protein